MLTVGTTKTNKKRSVIAQICGQIVIVLILSILIGWSKIFSQSDCINLA